MDLEQDARRAEQAQRILSSELYKEARRVIEERLIAELATIEISRDRAEYLRQLLVMGRKYHAYLEQVLFTGKMAEEQKSLLERVKDKLPRF